MCGRTVVVICVSKDGDLGSNDLFHEEQVREMVSAGLLSEDIVDAEIVVVHDCDEDAEWLDKVLEAAGNPEEGMIWSGNQNVLELAKEQGVGTKEISLVPGHVSAEIREMIKSGDRTWMEKVPGGANDVVMDWKVSQEK